MMIHVHQFARGVPIEEPLPEHFRTAGELATNDDARPTRDRHAGRRFAHPVSLARTAVLRKGFGYPGTRAQRGMSGRRLGPGRM